MHLQVDCACTNLVNFKGEVPGLGIIIGYILF